MQSGFLLPFIGRINTNIKLFLSLVYIITTRVARAVA